jgi:hypothetical protein
LGRFIRGSATVPEDRYWQHGRAKHPTTKQTGPQSLSIWILWRGEMLLSSTRPRNISLFTRAPLSRISWMCQLHFYKREINLQEF